MKEVVKKFLYAPNIYSTVELKKGDKIEIEDSVVDGLTSEGFIKPAPIQTSTASTSTTTTTTAPKTSTTTTTTSTTK